MKWHDILKLKYGEKDIKRLFDNMSSFGNKSTMSIVIPLFNLIYFNKPLSAKERIELRRMASHTTNIEVSKVLSNLAAAGSKIIESDRILPLDKKEMRVNQISIYGAGNLYSREGAALTIGLRDEKKISALYLEVKDGLYRFTLSKTFNLSHGDVDNQYDFIKKIVDYFNKRKDCQLDVVLDADRINEHMYDPSFEDVIDWLRKWEDGEYDKRHDKVWYDDGPDDEDDV